MNKHAKLMGGGGPASLLGRLGESEVGRDGLEVAEEFLGLHVINRGMDDDVISWLPVRGGGDRFGTDL